MSSKKQKRLFIIDGYATLYRAHYALIRNPLTNSAGTPTSAIFGFANQVFQLIEEEKPDYLVAAFDSKGKNFRHEVAVLNAYDEFRIGEKVPRVL
jgi:DNA polymerase-1